MTTLLIVAASNEKESEEEKGKCGFFLKRLQSVSIAATERKLADGRCIPIMTNSSSQRVPRFREREKPFEPVYKLSDGHREVILS